MQNLHHQKASEGDSGVMSLKVPSAQSTDTQPPRQQSPELHLTVSHGQSQGTAVSHPKIVDVSVQHHDADLPVSQSIGSGLITLEELSPIPEEPKSEPPPSETQKPEQQQVNQQMSDESSVEESEPESNDSDDYAELGYIPYDPKNGFVSYSLAYRMSIERSIRARRCRWECDYVRDTQFANCSFSLAAGVVVIQPSSEKMLLLRSKADGSCFLPEIRKYPGECLEEAAFRGAFERTGYNVQPFPLKMNTHGRTWPRKKPIIEAIYITSKKWNTKTTKHRGTHIIHWYAGQIPEGAVREEGAGPGEEDDYDTCLLTFEEAMDTIADSEHEEAKVAEYAWKLYCNTRADAECVRKENELVDAASPGTPGSVRFQLPQV